MPVTPATKQTTESPRFVHLRVHTEYSLVDSVVRIPELMREVAARGMPAVAMTDHCNMFAMVKFYRQALRHGVKPIVGVDLVMRHGEDEQTSVLSLLCQDQSGYRNLTRLVTRSFIEGQHKGQPTIAPEWLQPEAVEGLIALSGGHAGAIGQALLGGRDDDACKQLEWFRGRFPDRYYIEVQRTGRDQEETYLHRAVKLAAATDTPLVATNEVCFLDPAQSVAHDARVCIHAGYTLDDPNRPRNHVESQYLRSPADMDELFADLPEALANTWEIAQRCNLKLTLGESYLPEFPIPGGQSAADYLRERAREGLKLRLERASAAPLADYDARLSEELGVIEKMGFPGYFLIVADFIDWSRNNGVPVGPGRGSGAGSLVAYCLRITDLDPLQHELLFERFLNPERVSMPDFDIDFCMEGRDRVIDYVAQRYGRDRVAQIITYGSMAARAVVRDVGRVLGHPYGFVDRVAKLIPFEIGMTLAKALEQDEELRRQYGQEDEIRAIIDLALQLEGLARNAGKHAGGVVISPSVLTDFAPLYCEAGGTSLVTQFDKDDVEAVGLVKFDFLGLRTLTIIAKAVARINQQRAAQGEGLLDIDTEPTDDAATYDLLKRCQTTAVFQLESRGMKDLVKRLKPDRFEDIVALVALFRPGPLQSGMVDDFIKRKHGEEPIHYPHPALKHILKPTYGVILYQEQVMQIAQDLAGYSLGGADLLRRAMGKKKPEEMARQRSVFLTGAEGQGVEAATAEYIFDLMEKFAGYGFNKSHSAAYAVLSFQTAWLKAHYPAAFMAAVLSSDMDNTDKIVMLIDECRVMEIEVAPPAVNHSQYEFDVAGEHAIRYGLGAIKGLGRSAVDDLLAERASGGEFTDLFDLCARLDLHKVNRRGMEALIKAGACDALAVNRATLLAELPGALRAAEQSAQASAAGQEDLFGVVQCAAAPTAGAAREHQPDWPEAERLAAEKEALGLYLSGHPFRAYEPELRPLTSGKLGELLAGQKESNGFGRKAQPAIIAGLIFDVRRRGNRVTLTFDDDTGRMEATLFDEVYQRHRDIIAKDRIMVAAGGLRFDEFLGAKRLNVKSLLDVHQFRERFASRIVIDWLDGAPDPDFVAKLRRALEDFRSGACHIRVRYRGARAAAELDLGAGWQVRPTRELLTRLERLAGERQIRVAYPRGDGALLDLS